MPDLTPAAELPPAEPQVAAPRGGFGRDLWLSFLANLLFAMGLGLYLQLLNVYALKLGAPKIMVGVLVAINLAVTALGYIPGAWAADHFRLKPIIVAVWWITVPTAISFALAPSWPWLIPGYVLSGMYMANNPAFKVYMMLKSEPALMARNISYVFASYPLGLAMGPLAGGYIAQHFGGMRVVFLVAIVFYVASSTVISLIKDTPYHAAGRAWKLSDLTANLTFRRNLVFFLGGFLAVYLAQPFVQPYLAQVHDMGYQALGVFAAIGAVGGSAITFVAGRTMGLYGARRGIGITMVCILIGAVLLLAGSTPLMWGFAVFFYGAFDSFRFVTAGTMSGSFGTVPPTWGYAVFDASMGLPMVAGSILGGALYRQSYSLPFEVVIVIVVVMLVALFTVGRAGSARKQRSGAVRGRVD